MMPTPRFFGAMPSGIVTTEARYEAAPSVVRLLTRR